MIDLHHGWNVSYKPQWIGLILSLLVLLSGYCVATQNSSIFLPIAIVGSAVIQALIQLVFFFHLGLESRPRWNLIMFLFTVVVIVIVVGGSLWIMHHLDYHLMPHMEQHEH